LFGFTHPAQHCAVGDVGDTLWVRARRHIGPDVAGADGVHGDVVRAEVEGEPARQADEHRLATGVGRVLCQRGPDAGNGSDVHDAATAVLYHARAHRLDAPDGAFDVDSDEPVDGINVHG